jgi:hypothetical protein
LTAPRVGAEVDGQNMSTPTAIVDAHHRAYAEKNIDALLATLADEFVCAPLGGDPWLTGRASARAMYTANVEDWPLANTTTLAAMALGSVVVRRDHTVAKDPAKGALDSLAIYTVRDGLIARLDMAPREGDEAAAVALATRQLAAYNAQQLDEHCACFAEDIAVSDLGAAVTLSGISAYRARYAAMFAQHPQNHAELVARVSLGSTVIDHERVRRTPESEPFEVFAIYKVREGRIARVNFVRAT